MDDAATNRKFLHKLLRNRGHYCEEAEDGLQGLNMVKAAPCYRADTNNSDGVTDWNSRPYDAILMDYVMPKMNGPDATRALREFRYTGPIIGLTGNALDQDKTFFINAGATDVLIKPLQMNLLKEIINV